MKILEYKIKDKIRNWGSKIVDMDGKKEKDRLERERRISRINHLINIEAQKAFQMYTQHLESRVYEIVRNELK